jgi:transposase
LISAVRRDSRLEKRAVTMSDLFWLTDAQMARLEPFFPKSHGKPRVDDRRVLSGIIFINRNGLRWRDAPSAYGPHKTLYSRWKRWSDKGGSYVTLAALDQAKNTRVQITFLHGGMDRLGHDFPCAGMRAVTFHDDRATSSKRRRRVAARNRKREWEVRRTENRHWADRALHQPQIRTRQWGPIRQGLIMAAIQIRAVQNMLRKQA